MADRFNRDARVNQRTNFAPLPIPDYQQQLKEQLSFLKTMDALMNRGVGGGGGGGSSLRGEDGLTPYQREQLRLKEEKLRQAAADKEAKKNVTIGTNPKTGEDIIFRNESGKSLGEKERARLLQQRLEEELRKDITNDEELNRINGILYGPQPISVAYRTELERKARDRTKALALAYNIDDRTAFDAAYGKSHSILKEQKKNLRNDSFLGTLGTGISQGLNDFLNAGKMLFAGSDEERLEIARQAAKERQEYIDSSPTLTERNLREQEAAQRGEDIGYFDAADTNLASNIAASVGSTLASFAPAIGTSVALAPITGGGSTLVGTGFMAGIGAGMNQLGHAERVVADPTLTEEQRKEAVSYSDPGFAGTTALGGVAGALAPGGIGGAVLRGVGMPLAKQGVTKGIGGAIARGAERSAARLKAPASAGAFVRDALTTSAENSAIMGANTLLSNAAYNASTDKPLSQDISQGFLPAIGEGAIIGVPFGGARTIRRIHNNRGPERGVVVEEQAPAEAAPAAAVPAEAAPTAAVPAEAAPTAAVPAEAAPTAAVPAGTTPLSRSQRLRSDKGYQAWGKELTSALGRADEAKVDSLIGEYLASGGRIEDLQLLRDSYERVPGKGKALGNYISENEFSQAHNGEVPIRAGRVGWASRHYENMDAALARWNEENANGTLGDKISRSYTAGEGQGRLAAIMAELESGREGNAPRPSVAANSAVATNTTGDAGQSAATAIVQDSTNNPAATGTGTGGKPAQNIGQAQVNPADAVQTNVKPIQEANVAASAGSTGAGSQQASNGTGNNAVEPVGRNGGTVDAAAVSGEKQSSGQFINWGYGTHEINGKKFVTLSDPNGTVYSGSTKVQGKNNTRQWAILENGKRKKIFKSAKSPSNQELSNIYNTLKANDEGSVRKSLSAGEKNLPRESGKESTGFDDDVRMNTMNGDKPLSSNLRRLFTSPEEKRVLGELDASRGSPAFADNIRKAAEVIMKKLPGFKRGRINTFAEPEYPDGTIASGLYYVENGDISLNELGIHSAQQMLQVLNHEIGHKGLHEIADPSTRTFVAEQTFLEAPLEDAAMVGEFYGDQASYAYLGEELFAERIAGAAPFTDIEGARTALLDLYGSKANTKASEQVSSALSFFAQNADSGTFAEVAASAIVGSKAHADMFFHSDPSTIENKLAANMVRDYQTVTADAGVPRNAETLGYYLEAILDPDTELNVFRRQSTPC